jgi:hypothetical protein
MRAMVYRGPYKVRVEDKDIPRIEHPNDAIIRVTLGAICGSDLHLYHGLMPDTRIGHTFGHEFIGVVHEVGSSVQNLKVGDRVMVPFNIFCGSCWFCARGLYSNCHNVNANATRWAPSTATRTPPAATTAARRSTCGCPSPTSAGARPRLDERRGRRACSDACRRLLPARSWATSPRATPSWCSAPGPCLAVRREVGLG